MLMTRDITWMDETSMEVASLWSFPEGHLVALGIMTAEAHLLVQVAALTVVLTVIGLETALQGTGRTSVTAVGREVTLRETAKTVPRSSGEVEATPGHL